MSTQLSLGLARLTLAASDRRIDIALPEHAPLATLMPTLLRYVGESLQGDTDGAAGAGWSLRRSDGTPLAYERSLAAQQVRDGEILHLVPREKEWPEPEYDDIVLAVADSSRGLGVAWQGWHTRVWALAGTSAALLVGLVVLLLSGPDRTGPALGGLVVAAVALAVGVVLSRAAGDSSAGAAIAANALPYAFLGGAGALDSGGVNDFGAAHLLVGSAALLLASVLGFVGTADRLWLFTAGGVVALLGVTAAAVLGLTSASAAGAAAVAACAALALMPMAAVLAVRLAKLPLPELPQSTADLLREAPLPPRNDIAAAVARTGEFFAGILLGISVTVVVCDLVLIASGGVAGPVLAGVVSVLCVLRARMVPLTRQRVPLLASAAIGFALLAVGAALAVAPASRPLVAYLGLLPVALLVAAAGITYSRRRPSPFLGRIADIGDIVLAVSVVPVAAGVFGLYEVVRGLAG